jgi:hypothetical protein
MLKRENSKYIFISAFIVIGIFLLINFFLHLFAFNNENNALFDKIKSRKIKSIIIRKSIDYSNHGATYIVYKGDSLPTHTGWDEKIEIGDSIIKPKGALKIIIKNDFKSDTLDYESNQDEVLSTNF